MPGVLTALSCTDPPELGSAQDVELALVATREVSYRGQLIAAVVADTLENARAAAAVLVTCDRHPHDVRLRADDPGLYTPAKVTAGMPAVTSYSDVEAGLAWDAGGRLTVYDSTQGPSADRDTIAQVLGLPPDWLRVISPHVGGASEPMARPGRPRSWPRWRPTRPAAR